MPLLLVRYRVPLLEIRLVHRAHLGGMTRHGGNANIVVRILGQIDVLAQAQVVVCEQAGVAQAVSPQDAMAPICLYGAERSVPRPLFLQPELFHLRNEERLHARCHICNHQVSFPW